MSVAITLRDLTVSYDRVPAVHHVSGEFASGSLTAITGSNGAGKSTLLKAIAGILPIFEGEILFHGITRQDMAYLPQAADVQRDFPLSVLQMVASGHWQNDKGFGRITRAQKERSLQAIEEVGLSHLAHRTLDALSAGQFQRALFARILVQNAQLILLDEPFTAIDENTTEILLGIIHQWNAEGRTVLCVLHDYDQIKSCFPECVLMAKSCVAWGKTAEVLTPEHVFAARFGKQPHHHKDHA